MARYKLTKPQRAELMGILAVQSTYQQEGGMVHHMMTRLASLGGAVTFDRGNVYAVKGVPNDGEAYPCFVAHLDTVHTVHHPSRYGVYIDPDGRIMGYDPVTNTLSGIGGDDKVGLYIALQMFKELPAAKVALFSGEEMGCIGANRADMTFFADVTSVIECDRRGNTDIVNEIGGSLLFDETWQTVIQAAMDRHEYKLSGGMITDVGTLMRKGLPVVACNLSCGYYNPHSEDEYIIPRDVVRCLALVREMTLLTAGVKFPAPDQDNRWHARSYKFAGTGDGALDTARRFTSPYTGTAIKSCPTCHEDLFRNGLCPVCDHMFCPSCPKCGAACEEDSSYNGQPRGWCEHCFKFVDIMFPDPDGEPLVGDDDTGEFLDLGDPCPVCGDDTTYLGQGMEVCKACDVLYVNGKPYSMNTVRETAALADPNARNYRLVEPEYDEATFSIIEGGG